MRVRVVISYDFSEDERRTVNAYYGDPGLADRKTLKRCIEIFGEPTNDNWVFTFNYLFNRVWIHQRQVQQLTWKQSNSLATKGYLGKFARQAQAV